MGFGNGGFARDADQITDISVSGAETSLNSNADTDIIVFTMTTPFNVGVDEDPAAHTVATSVVVDTP